MTKYNVTTLANGLRVIHLPSVSPVVYCGIGINAGARHEAPGEEGLAHFCEHTTFKGTRRRSALQILNALESVGGDLNAFTNKEDTVFYAAIQREHFSRAVDLLCDIVFCSEYPQHEIEREIDVICDEIEIDIGSNKLRVSTHLALTSPAPYQPLGTGRIGRGKKSEGYGHPYLHINALTHSHILPLM